MSFIAIILTIVIILIIIILLRRYVRGPNATPKDMSGKIVIITGSSAGIGKQHAFELLKQGATVIFACRDQKKTLSVLEETKSLKNSITSNSPPFERAYYMQLDLSSFQSVLSFVKEFKSKFNTLDILCNNAGYIASKYKLTQDGLEEMAQTNHFSHVLLTLLLLPQFNKVEGRVINVSSMGHFASNYPKSLKTNFSPKSDQFKDLFNSMLSQTVAYANTKYANILFTNWLAEKISKEAPNLSAYSLHPGVINSSFLTSYKDSCSWYRKVLIFLLTPVIWLFFKTEYDGAQCQLHLSYESQPKLKNGGYYRDLVLTEVSIKDEQNEMRDYLMNETLSVISNYIK